MVVRGLATLAGIVSVSKQAIAGWVDLGCPHWREGFGVYFDLSDVADWLEARPSKQHQQLAKQVRAKVKHGKVQFFLPKDNKPE
jgi:hypothetical protein